MFSSPDIQAEQGDSTEMIKKMLFVLMLALQTAAVTNVANATWPWPLCWSTCPDAK